MKQVDKKHYDFNNYCYPDRWASYWHQIHEINATHPTSVLEIGAGDYVVKHYISHTLNIPYTVMDIAEDLAPDVIGSITNIPLSNNTFDTVVAFEVLEHIPFEEVPQALSELARVVRNKVVISVPHFGPMISFSLKIPFLKKINFAVKIPFPIEHKFNGQHYWEIGKKNYDLKTMKKLIEKFFIIDNTFVPLENSYHRFFVLRKRKNINISK